VTYTPAEYEVFGLIAAAETIDEMVNHTIFRVFEGDPVHLLFEGPSQRQLFSAFLLDFLSMPDSSLVGLRGTHIEVLGRIAKVPVLRPSASMADLLAALGAMEAWLEGRFTIELASTTASMEMSRGELARLVGNMSKHKFARLTAVVRTIQQIVERSGVTLRAGDLRLVVDELHERLSQDLIVYHANALAELLNNIRWAVHDYLVPVFEGSYRVVQPPLYRYEFPGDVTDDLARAAFWDLMNDVRRGPHMRRFKVSDAFRVPEILKGKY
jgi:hypothetical protein